MIGIFEIIFVSRKWGIGISPDSTQYISVANNLLDGHGFVQVPISFSYDFTMVPLVGAPPFYPLLLAAFSLIARDVVFSARLLSTMFFGANIILVGIIIYRLIPRPNWYSIYGALLMLTSSPMLYIHTMAWTEPIFIFMGLLGILLVTFYIENGKLLFIIISSLLIGLACLTRYAGVAFIGTGVVSIIFVGRKKFRKRLFDFLMFLIISIIPIGLWIIRNMNMDNKPLGIGVAFRPMELEWLKNGFLNTFSLWLLPGIIPLVFRFVFLLIVIVGLFFSIFYLLGRKKTNDIDNEADSKNNSKLFLILIIFAALYIMMIVISKLFFAPLSGIYRQLSPLYIPCLILFLYFIKVLFDFIRKKMVRLSFIFAICFILIGSIFRGVGWIIKYHGEGRQIEGRRWRESPIINEIKHIPSYLPIYSNGGDIIYFFTGRITSRFPNKMISRTEEMNPQYPDQIDKMISDLRDRDALLVFFYEPEWRGGKLLERLIKKEAQLKVTFECDYGKIYKQAD